MTSQRKIELFIPGLFWAEGCRELQGRGQQPIILEKVLARSRCEHLNEIHFTETLFARFGILADSCEDLPIGAVSYYGGGGEPGDGCWSLATPIHLLVDRDRVILVRPSQQSFNLEYAEHIAALFNKHFKNEGLRLVLQSQTDWYLNLDCCPEIKTSDIECVAGRHIEEYLPSGKEGYRWRSILNEIQMLFCGNSINEINMHTNEHVVNGLWLNGFGHLKTAKADYSAVYTDMPLLMGLAKLSGVPCYPIPDKIDDIFHEGGNVLMLLPGLLQAEMDADFNRWTDALAQIDSLFDDLFYQTNKSNILDKFEIYPCSGRSYSITSIDFRSRFWRRKKKLSGYISM
ncbi:MAG: hypothetical protein PVI97_07350 [Candidatus Thiodiazotropha sp.]